MDKGLPTLVDMIAKERVILTCTKKFLRNLRLRMGSDGSHSEHIWGFTLRIDLIISTAWCLSCYT